MQFVFFSLTFAVCRGQGGVACLRRSVGSERPWVKAGCHNLWELIPPTSKNPPVGCNSAHKHCAFFHLEASKNFSLKSDAPSHITADDAQERTSKKKEKKRRKIPSVSTNCSSVCVDTRWLPGSGDSCLVGRTSALSLRSRHRSICTSLPLAAQGSGRAGWPSGGTRRPISQTAGM